jgi:hypothetical protein
MLTMHKDAPLACWYALEKRLPQFGSLDARERQEEEEYARLRLRVVGSARITSDLQVAMMAEVTSARIHSDTHVAMMAEVTAIETTILIIKESRSGGSLPTKVRAQL